MGSNLSGFDIELTFDAQGSVEEIQYVDQEGCGHSRKVSSELTLADVVRYHMDHYRQRHGMTPPKRCGFEVIGDGLTFRCLIEPHDTYTKHKLEQV